MEKIWFIFEKDHHLGPFSTKDIESLYEKGQIGPFSQLWKESVSDWVSLEEVKDFSHLFQSNENNEKIEPPELPDLPPIEEHVEISNDEVLPQTPLEEIQTEEVSSEHVEKSPNEEIEINEVVGLPSLPQNIELSESPPEPVVVKESLQPTQEAEEKVEEVIEEESLEEEITQENKVFTPPIFEEKVDLSPMASASETLEVEDSESEFEESTGEFDLSAQVQVNEEADQFEEEEYYVENIPKKSSSSWLKIPVSLLFVLAILFSIFMFTNKHKDENLFAKLSDDKFHSLMALTKKGPSSKIRMKLALTSDGSDLWLATNFKGEALLQLKLKSFKGRVLTDEVIKVAGKANLKNGAAYFDKLELIEGEKLVAGQYMAQVIGEPQGPLAQFSRWLIDIGVGDNFSFAKKSTKRIQYRGSVLLFGGSSSDFESKLSKFKKDKLEQEIIPYRDRLESYKTLKAMVSNISETYFERLKSIRKGKDIKDFEADFATQISPILQELVIGIHTKHQSYIGKSAKIALAYEELLNYAKLVGEMGSDMMTQTGSSKKVRKKDRARLRRIFEKRSLELKTQAEDNLQKHYDQILYLRSKS